MKKIPLYIVEEHHEAFFVWNYAILTEVIEDCNNTLLHVDEHGDMEVPRFNTSIKSIRESLQSLYTFTYDELGITRFIIPAIYQGIFNELCWLHPRIAKSSQKRILHVCSHNQQGKALQTSGNIHHVGVLNPDRKSLSFQLKTVHDECPPTQPTVLDIDLDYFSCNDNLNSSQIEVTKNEYDSFTQNKYHILRLMPKKRVEAKIEDGKYYLCLNSFPDELPSILKVSKSEILKRIDMFIDFIRNNKIEPQLIDVCRSRFSGFTPEDQWAFIEEKLIERLGALFNLEIFHISDISVPGS